MNRFFFFLFFISALSLQAQTNPKIKELESKRSLLQKQISQKENILTSTKKGVRTQLNNLSTLTGQIEERKHYIAEIEKDLIIMDGEIAALDNHLKELQQQLEERRKKYAKSLQTLYRAKSFHEKLMFIFSASSLQEAYRRSRYLQDYAAYQHVLGQGIEQQQKKILLKREELESVRQTKTTLLKEGEAQRQKLEAQEKERRDLVAQLQKQQKGLTQEISRHRQEAHKLNTQIDRMVAIEVEKARKKAEEEKRRRAEAATQAKKSGSATTKPETPASGKQPVKPMESYTESNEDVRLSRNFTGNRGRLPIPITGSYIIVNRYGQYNVEGLRGVRLDNKGINLQGQPGAQARAIFDGEVVSVFKVDGLSNIIIRHGSYMSVYCNLSSTSVVVGEKVTVRQPLGQVFSDPNEGGRTILHFQLRKETQKLNPEQWLAR